MDVDRSMTRTGAEYPLSSVQLLSWREPVDSVIRTFDLGRMFSGDQLGPLGAVPVMALLAGGIYLMARGHMRPHVPLAFLAGMWIAASVFRAVDPDRFATPIFHLAASGAVFGAFFLAPLAPCAPVFGVPMLLFGALGGILTVVIRSAGILPDGTPMAILVACLAAPFLSKIRPRPLGRVKLP